MNSYEKIKTLLLEDPQRGPMRQRSRAQLSQVPQERQMRGQSRGVGSAGPHTAYDPGEASPKQVKRTVAELKAEIAAELENPRLTGIKRGQKLRLQRYYASLPDDGEPGQTRSAENASTEINMGGYERIYEMLIKEDDAEYERAERLGRLRNKEAGSILARKNQRRITRIKAGLKRFLGVGRT